MYYYHYNEELVARIVKGLTDAGLDPEFWKSCVTMRAYLDGVMYAKEFQGTTEDSDLTVKDQFVRLYISEAVICYPRFKEIDGKTLTFDSVYVLKFKDTGKFVMCEDSVSGAFYSYKNDVDANIDRNHFYSYYGTEFRPENCEAIRLIS